MSQQERLVLTIEQAAEQLSVSRTTVYQLIRSGAIKPVRFGTSVRIAFDELRRFVKERQAN